MIQTIFAFTTEDKFTKNVSKYATVCHVDEITSNIGRSYGTLPMASWTRKLPLRRDSQLYVHAMHTTNGKGNTHAPPPRSSENDPEVAFAGRFVGNAPFVHLQRMPYPQDMMLVHGFSQCTLCEDSLPCNIHTKLRTCRRDAHPFVTHILMKITRRSGGSFPYDV